MYRCYNGNLLYHGCIPCNRDGSFMEFEFGRNRLSGRDFLDYCDKIARQGYFAPEGSAERRNGQDFLWFLWCGRNSPIFGRSHITTFERALIEDKAAWKEPKNAYYEYYNDEDFCRGILAAFGLDKPWSRIVNGHIPVRAKEGENPCKAHGRLVVIDGGFCRAYHQRTGIAGYTLVYNSRGLILRTHQPFENTDKAIHEDEDITSKSEYIYTAPQRILVRDTDEGGRKQALIRDLTALVEAYQTGVIPQGVAQEL